MTLFLLLCGHALCDYPLQSDFMAREKNPWMPVDLSRVPPGQTPTKFWPWVLSAHAMIHGGAVALITGYASFGVAEAICHWAIDLAKCAGFTGIHVDQCLHVACKLVWFALLFAL